ncbi:hypothetical protein BC831DRAFT_443302 [Entophlyctis helioformis]|nr:hypothetical protein BC831DRAFT_443302 [Entophlyctis helioformis]
MLPLCFLAVLLLAWMQTSAPPPTRRQLSISSGSSVSRQWQPSPDASPFSNNFSNNDSINADVAIDANTAVNVPPPSALDSSTVMEVVPVCALKSTTIVEVLPVCELESSNDDDDEVATTASIHPVILPTCSKHESPDTHSDNYDGYNVSLSLPTVSLPLLAFACRSACLPSAARCCSLLRRSMHPCQMCPLNDFRRPVPPTASASDATVVAVKTLSERRVRWKELDDLLDALRKLRLALARMRPESWVVVWCIAIALWCIWRGGASDSINAATVKALQQQIDVLQQSLDALDAARLNDLAIQAIRLQDMNNTINILYDRVKNMQESRRHQDEQIKNAREE